MAKFLIIGMGGFGTRVAKYLEGLKNEVCIIDRNLDVVEKFKDDFRNALKADGMQKNVLIELGAKEYDACIVSCGDDFQSSLQITANLKDIGAKCIVTKCYSDVQERFLKMAGADEIVYPEKEAAKKVATTLTNKKIKDFMKIGDDYLVYETAIPKKWVGKTIVQLKLRELYSINILAVEKDNRVIVPGPDYVFEKSDLVFAFVKEDLVKSLFK